MNTVIEKIRNATPLSLRRVIGPYVGYLVYRLRTHFGFLFWRPHVLSIHETIATIQENKLSVIRIGDGELSLMIDHANLAFQKSDPTLARRLKEITASNDAGLLICIPGMWGDLSNFSKKAFWFAIHHTFRYTPAWKSLLNQTTVYGDTFFTRPHIGFKDKSQSAEIFQAIRNLWKAEQVVLIEGEKSRLGVGNDLFTDCASLQRILCPPEHAYTRYEAILSESKKVPKNKLILLSLGPTAKLLAYDLFKLRYRVIDIGHIDMEYEMFLRGYEKITEVPFKYFNEADARNPEECSDPAYAASILTTIKLT